MTPHPKPSSVPIFALSAAQIAQLSLDLGVGAHHVKNWERARRLGRGRGGVSEELERRLIARAVELGFVQ